ncbi:MAG: PocR ligand-binding domain-containing protein [Victivallales bacterium]|jgi:PAS domain S-box-containing protein
MIGELMENQDLVDGKYSIGDLVDLERLRHIFEEFSQATGGFTVGFLDHPGMNILIAVNWRDICTKFHRGCPMGSENCTKSNKHLLDQLTEPGKLTFEECENGLVDCATPIIIKGKHIASLATGQLLLKKPDIERFKRQARLFGFDEKEYLDALREIPVIPEDKVGKITAFLADIAVMISELGYANLEIKEKAARLESEIIARKKIEDELRNSVSEAQRASAQIEAVFQSMADGVVVFDMAGKALLINEAEAKICGYASPEEMKRDMEYFARTYVLSHPDGRLAPLEDWPVSHVLRGETVTDMELKGRRLDTGQEWFFSYSGKPVRDSQGNQILALLVCRDITERKRAEAELLENAERLRNIMQHARCILWNGNIVGMPGWEKYSKGSGKLFKWSMAILDEGAAQELIPLEVTDHNYAEAWRISRNQDDSICMEDVSSTAFARGDSHYVQDFRCTDRFGRVHWLHEEVVIRPVSTGRWSAYGVVTDITERKHAELALRQGEERLNFALKMSRTGGWELDLVDHSAYRTLEHDLIFGYSPPPPQWTYEMFIKHVIPEDRAEVDRRFQEAIAKQTDWSFECRIRRSDDEIRWIWAAGKHQHDVKGQVRKMAGIVQDITDRKEAEEEVRKLNSELERRVVERTAQLAAANRELESFSYSVSHDLRAPLRGIDGWSLALMEDYNDKLDEQGRQYLSRVRSETQRMGHLIDDILQLSRIGRTELRLTRTDISALARKISERLKTENPGRRIDFVIQPELAAHCDENLLEIAMTNLMNNAVKFTGRREDARIKFGMEKEHGHPVYFVRDNGAGFDMAYAQKLFGAFQRMHRVSEFPGTGVGLAIVQRIIHLHGGKAWADAKVDQGATFYFTMQS